MHVRYGVHSFHRAWKMVSSPIYRSGNPIARGNTSPLTQLIRMIGMKPALCGQVNPFIACEVFAAYPAFASQLSGPGLMLLQRTNCWILSHSRVRRLKISAFSGQLRQLFELHSTLTAFGYERGA